jgi:hypothetical protein
MSSTCALELTLPTKYHDNEKLFKEMMTYGMLNLVVLDLVDH